MFACVRRHSLRLAVAFVVALQAMPASAFTDAALIDGFRRTVFGSEFRSFGWQADIVKKYMKPVRVHVDDRSRARRGGDVEAFVRSLPRLIRGLEIELVGSAAEANFRVFVIDRKDYDKVIAREVSGVTAGHAPGKCLVRIVSSAAGISRSDAVIVADEGDALFRRCTVEEVLQGLGPANDDATLSESVFNDSSRHLAFTAFDRHILNMLYDPRIRPGMSEREASRLLPQVAADVRARLR
jgi:hypothetical protein